MKLLLIVLLLPTSLFAFTLNTTGKGFKSNKITVHVASTSCAGAGFSTAKFRELLKEAVDEYWHQVPTSSIELNVREVGDVDIDGDDFSQAVLKAQTNTILAGCNDDATGFDGGGASSTTLGAAMMTCSNEDCKAVLILNAHADSLLPTLDESEVKATIAHEIGHAFGLGHSEYKYSLMYYSAGGKVQKWLGQDDIDGVSYLYPNDPQIGGLIGSCGTISTDDDDYTNFFTSFISGFFAVIFLLTLRKIIYILTGSLREYNLRP